MEETILSVLGQTYENIELIVVDDASTDASVPTIEKLTEKHPEIKFIKLERNVGNCAAFNRGFEVSKGEYIIDLAADDILLPDRIATGVNAFLRKDKGFGVQFSNPELINENGNHLGYHSDKFPNESIPEGEIYKELISRYFISGPSMMVRREVFDRIGGYDEDLAYEDFDFWIRSSREFKFFYLPETLVKRRVVRNSMKSNQFKRNSMQQYTTYLVCKKIQSLNQNEDEDEALLKRIRYEMKVSLRLLNIRLLLQYLNLWWSVKFK